MQKLRWQHRKDRLFTRPEVFSWLITTSRKEIPQKAAAFLYSIIEGRKLPKRILIGRKCCEDVKAYLEERISEIESNLDESSQTDFDVEQ